MKIIISLIVAAAMLTGCAGASLDGVKSSFNDLKNGRNPLDNQNASKGVKTAEAAAGCGVIGAGLAKLFGGNTTIGAGIGALSCGALEYFHETDRELKVAKDEAARMKAAGIDAKATPGSMSIKDDKGVIHESTVLSDYFVPASNDIAIKSVSNVITESDFGGQVVIIANPSQRKEIEAGLKGTVDAKNLKNKHVDVAFLDAKKFAPRGFLPGISWKPTHNTAVADNGKKVGAA